MFEKFLFSKLQVDKYYKAACRDFKMLKKSLEPEIIFFLCYNIIIKTSIAICAKNGLRVKSRVGHHIELISKLADFIGDKEVEIVADKMRIKRNKDLYEGGVIITEKEAEYYYKFCSELIKQADNYINPNKLI